jgi:hypothetical protein
MLKQKTPNQASTNKKEKPDPLARFKKSLNASRALQETKLAEGVQGIDRYVEDVKGDWLENWDAPKE